MKMKKQFVVGFLCGSILSVTSAAFASNAIQAYLFPSKVTFHSGAAVKEIDSSEVLNYDNKAYVPLRSFAEASGSTVTFHEGTKETNFIHSIDVYAASNKTDDTEIKDADAFVSISNLKMVTSQGTTQLVAGTIQANKDLTGKAIDINILDSMGNVLTTTDYVYIDRQEVEPIHAGETRSFQTYASFNGEAASYQVVIRDLLRPEPKGITSMYGDPMVLSFGPPSGFTGTLPIGKFSPFTVRFYNTSSTAINVKPIDMQFSVYTTNGRNEAKDLVYSFRLPAISGTINANSGYSVTIPWNQRGSDGQVISPGHYIVKLSRPDTIGYSIEGSTDVKTFTLNSSTQYPTQFAVDYTN